MGIRRVPVPRRRVLVRARGTGTNDADARMGLGFVFLNSHGLISSLSVASAYQCRSVGVHPARHAITLLSCKRTRNLLVCGCSLAHSRGLVCRRGAWKLPCLSVHINPSRPAGHRLAFFWFGSSRARSAYQCRSVGVHPARHAITLLSCKRTRNLLVCGCSLAHSRGLVCRRGAWKLPCLSVHMNPAQAPV